MAESKRILSVDAEATSRVLAIIRDAWQRAVIVTPYIELWGHARDAITLAVKRGVVVTALVRDEPKVTESESVGWLIEQGVKVLCVEKLHAKIYLNEREVVLSSMNLTEFSAQNSHEVAWLVVDDEVQQEVRRYVTDTLQRLAKPVKSISIARPAVPMGQPVGPEWRGPDGRCVRCGGHIALDPYHPLCNDCYEDWAQWAKKDYPERFCHACGRPARVDYGRPLCDDCYRASR